MIPGIRGGLDVPGSLTAGPGFEIAKLPGSLYLVGTVFTAAVAGGALSMVRTTLDVGRS